jgi:hypothetical protein
MRCARVDELSIYKFEERLCVMAWWKDEDEMRRMLVRKMCLVDRKNVGAVGDRTLGLSQD